MSDIRHNERMQPIYELEIAQQVVRGIDEVTAMARAFVHGAPYQTTHHRALANEAATCLDDERTTAATSARELRDEIKGGDVFKALGQLTRYAKRRPETDEEIDLGVKLQESMEYYRALGSSAHPDYHGLNTVARVMLRNSARDERSRRKAELKELHLSHPDNLEVASLAAIVRETPNIISKQKPAINLYDGNRAAESQQTRVIGEKSFLQETARDQFEKLCKALSSKQITDEAVVIAKLFPELYEHDRPQAFKQFHSLKQDMAHLNSALKYNLDQVPHQAQEGALTPIGADGLRIIEKNILRLVPTGYAPGVGSQQRVLHNGVTYLCKWGETYPRVKPRKDGTHRV